MDAQTALADRFEQHRGRLRAVAGRLLGSPHEAEDAVQEAWLRLVRTGDDGIDELGAWLTTVVGRICLDALRSRTARREDAWPESADAPAPGPGPEEAALGTAEVAGAVDVVVSSLAPAERVAFVLHDLFAVPFETVAELLDRSPAAVRQLASRARRRVRGGEPAGTDPARQRAVVAAFLAASRGGDLPALLAVLAPDVELRSDAAAVLAGSTARVSGAAAVGAYFDGRAQAVRLVLVDGLAGAAWLHRGEPRVVFAFVVEDGQVTGIELLADPGTLADLELGGLPARRRDPGR